MASKAFFASVGMHLIVGEPGGTGDMHPPTIACHIHADFILMKHLRLHQGVLDLLLDLNQASGR